MVDLGFNFLSNFQLFRQGKPNETKVYLKTNF